MRRINKANILLVAVSILVLGIQVFGQRAQSQAGTIDLADWPCAKKCMTNAGESIPLANRSSAEILKSVDHSAPLEIPCCSKGLNISGEVTVTVLIDPAGNLKCARGEAGNPIAISSAIESLPKWHFKPYHRGHDAAFVSGQITLPYDFRKK